MLEVTLIVAFFGALWLVATLSVLWLEDRKHGKPRQ